MSLLSVERDLDFWEDCLDNPSFVYIVQGEPGTPIKVGVARNPRHRLQSLQTGNPVELRLLYVMPGSFPLEAELHYRLRDSSVRGEWFAEPGIDGFLIWVQRYIKEVKNYFDERGELLPPSNLREEDQKLKRRAGANILHRWRMSPPVVTPVEVRYVKPDPRTPEEIRDRLFKREQERGYALSRSNEKEAIQ